MVILLRNPRCIPKISKSRYFLKMCILSSRNIVYSQKSSIRLNSPINLQNKEVYSHSGRLFGKIAMRYWYATVSLITKAQKIMYWRIRFTQNSQSKSINRKSFSDYYCLGQIELGKHGNDYWKCPNYLGIATQVYNFIRNHYTICSK